MQLAGQAANFFTNGFAQINGLFIERDRKFRLVLLSEQLAQIAQDGSFCCAIANGFRNRQRLLVKGRCLGVVLEMAVSNGQIAEGFGLPLAIAHCLRNCQILLVKLNRFGVVAQVVVGNAEIA